MSNSRHKIIDGLVCKNCKKVYSARKQRVDAGLGIFCSVKCANKFRSMGSNKKYVGKENGKRSYDRFKKAYYVYWFDPETLRRRTTSYARWYWEMNHGDIPEGYYASYKDGNPLNIDPENIILISSKEFGIPIRNRMIGRTFTAETRHKMSIKKKGRKLSREHRRKIGQAELGSKNNFWIDGRSYIEYPPEFNPELKRRVRRRDKYTCKACGGNARGKTGHVHHIDGNKQNSDIHNLVLLCDACHVIVHMKSRTDNPIILLLQKSLASA